MVNKGASEGEAHDFITMLFAELGSQTPPDECVKDVDTLYFAELGNLIASRFDELKDPSGVFQIIEDGANSQNVALASAVLTGLVEEMQSVADDRPGLWRRIRPYLGSTTAAHATAMNAFLGIVEAAAPSM